MSQEMLMSIYDEIVKVRQLLEMTLKDKIEKELEKILTTKERKMVWALSDGLMDTKTIAKKAGVSQRAVQQTVKDLQIADFLVVERRGYPKRKFNYVPYDWTPKTKNGGTQS
jgi:DNA-binding HxlR family transcriptional regulator